MQSPAPRPYIGGQAVLEGVMMRAPGSFAVVVRRGDGSLHVREKAMPEAPKGVLRWPFVRGVATLVESLRMGNEALRFSVEQLESDMQSAAAGVRAPLGILGGALRSVAAFGLATAMIVTQADGSDLLASRGRKGGGAGIVMLAFAVLFFVALPQVAAAGINRIFGLALPVQSAGFQAITGILKLAIVVGYMLIIRGMPEIRRVFQYHGAEHKTISTYEAGEPLTVANARQKTTLHPRCGTTFLVMVAIVSILVFTALGALLPRIASGNAALDNLLFFAAKLPFLPLLVAITFELQRIFARFAQGPLRVLLWPGFWVQRITTAEPDDAQLEVALASLRVTLFRSDSGATTQSANGQAAEDDVRFPNYEALLSASTLR